DWCAADARLAYALGIVHSICGHRELAADAFRQSADLERHDPAPFVRLAGAVETSAERDPAIRAAIARAPMDPGLGVHLAEVLLSDHRYEAGRELLREAASMPGSDSWIQEQLRLAEERRRHHEEYQRLVACVSRLASTSTPDGATLLVISK